jgi:hypothetical protein
MARLDRATQRRRVRAANESYARPGPPLEFTLGPRFARTHLSQVDTGTHRA